MRVLRNKLMSILWSVTSDDGLQNKGLALTIAALLVKPFLALYQPTEPDKGRMGASRA